MLPNLGDLLFKISEFITEMLNFNVMLFYSWTSMRLLKEYLKATPYLRQKSVKQRNCVSQLKSTHITPEARRCERPTSQEKGPYILYKNYNKFEITKCRKKSIKQNLQREYLQNIWKLLTKEKIVNVQDRESCQCIKCSEKYPGSMFSGR